MSEIDTDSAPDVDVARRPSGVSPGKKGPVPTLREYVASIPEPESLREHGRRVGAQPTHRDMGPSA